jgi:hypothetical protein
MALTVDPSGSIAVPRTTGIGTSSPLAKASAKDRSPPRADVRSESSEGPVWGKPGRLPMPPSTTALADSSGPPKRATPPQTLRLLGPS